MSTAFPAAPAACMLIDTLNTVQFQLPSPLLVNNPPLPAIHCGIIPNPATHRKRSSERNHAPSCTRGDNLSVAMGQTAQFRHATGGMKYRNPSLKRLINQGATHQGGGDFQKFPSGRFPREFRTILASAHFLAGYLRMKFDGDPSIFSTVPCPRSFLRARVIPKAIP